MMHRNSSSAGEWHSTNPRVAIYQPAHGVCLDTVHIRILRWSHWQPCYNYSLDIHTMEVRNISMQLAYSHRTTARGASNYISNWIFF